MPVINFGHLVDPPRPGDLPFATSPLRGRTYAARLSPLVLPVSRPVREQTGGSCVANSSLGSIEAQADLDGVPLPKLSAMFGYRVARMEHGGEKIDGGTYIYTFAEAVSHVGCCADEVWPDSAGELTAPPPPMAFVDAFDRIIDRHYAIDDGDLDAFEDALTAGHFPVFGVEVSPEFVRYSGGLHVFGPPERVIGRHAMFVRGVRGIGASREWLVRNSWGRAWGDAGEVWISSAYLATAKSARVFTRAPS